MYSCCPIPKLEPEFCQNPKPKFHSTVNTDPMRGLLRYIDELCDDALGEWESPKFKAVELRVFERKIVLPFNELEFSRSKPEHDFRGGVIYDPGWMITIKWRLPHKLDSEEYQWLQKIQSQMPQGEVWLGLLSEREFTVDHDFTYVYARKREDFLDFRNPFWEEFLRIENY